MSDKTRMSVGLSISGRSKPNLAYYWIFVVIRGLPVCVVCWE